MIISTNASAGAAAANSPGGLAQPKKTGLYRSLYPTGGGTGSSFANTMSLAPFAIPANKTYTFSGFGVNGLAASNFRFAIASSDAAGDPASILFESGAVNVAGAGAVTGAVSLAMTTTTDSLYWLAMVCDTTGGISAPAGSFPFANMLWGMPGGGLGGNGAHALSKARTYATGAIVIGDLALSGYANDARAPGVFFKFAET